MGIMLSGSFLLPALLLVVLSLTTELQAKEVRDLGQTVIQAERTGYKLPFNKNNSILEKAVTQTSFWNESYIKSLLEEEATFMYFKPEDLDIANLGLFLLKRERSGIYEYSVAVKGQECIIKKVEIDWEGGEQNYFSKGVLQNHSPSSPDQNHQAMSQDNHRYDRVIDSPSVLNTRFCSLRDMWNALNTKSVYGNDIWISDKVCTRTASKTGGFYEPAPSLSVSGCPCPVHLGSAIGQVVKHVLPCTID